MSELKFRAWDKKKNDWFDDDGGSLYIELNGTINFGWNGEVMDDYTDRVILLQYTGLKDRNGVEIYEGDIIRGMDVLSERTGDRIDDREVAGKVVIDVSSCWGFSIVAGNAEYHLYDFLENDQEAEVIGNAYENPELLEG